MPICSCKPWKRTRDGHERRCRIGKRRISADLYVWGGDVTVSIIDSALPGVETQRFPHVGPSCRLDEAKEYANRWLDMRCDDIAEGRR